MQTALETAANRWRRLSKPLGLVLTLVALAFVGWSLHRTGLPEDFNLRDPALLAALAGTSIAYGLTLLLVAFGWWKLVKAASPDTSLRGQAALAIYARSQLYKYLPSNMLHYVGRHAALVRNGAGHSSAAFTAVAETGLLVVAAVAVSVFADLGQFRWLSSQANGPLLIAGGVGLLAVVAGAVHWRGLDDRALAVTDALRAPRLRGAIAVSTCSYMIFFVASGAAFAVIACTIGPWRASDAPSLISVWSACWALGFVTPGAPAGIGVREALLIAALTFGGHPETAVVVAAAMRLVTTLGDLVFAAVGWAAERLRRRPAGLSFSPEL